MILRVKAIYIEYCRNSNRRNDRNFWICNQITINCISSGDSTRQLFRAPFRLNYHQARYHYYFVPPPPPPPNSIKENLAALQFNHVQENKDLIM